MGDDINTTEALKWVSAIHTGCQAVDWLMAGLGPAQGRAQKP